MDLSEALIARLTPAVAGLGVGARIYWGVRPQGSPLPALVLVTISSVPDQLLEGEGDVWQSRVQLEGYARTHLEATNIAKAASAALLDEATVGTDPDTMEFEPGERTGPRDLAEPDETGKPVHRVIMDSIIRHSAGT
jgi:hypothetical protein